MREELYELGIGQAKTRNVNQDDLQELMHFAPPSSKGQQRNGINMNEGEIVATLTMEPRDEAGNKVSILSRFQNKYISDNRTGSALTSKMNEV